jgi:hypothetical protein
MGKETFAVVISAMEKISASNRDDQVKAIESSRQDNVILCEEKITVGSRRPYMLKAVKYRKYGDETSIRQTISGAFRVTCQ